MAITIEMYETICAYFDGELSLDEEKRFLELVEQDPELKKEFEWEEKMIFNSVPDYKDLSAIASDTGLAGYSIKDEASPATIISNLKPRFYKKWAIAASLLAILSTIALILVLSDNNKSNSNKISIENFNHKDSQTVIFALIKNKQDSIKKIKKNELEIATANLKKKEINGLGRHQPDLSAESPQLGQIQEAFITGDYSGTIDLSDKPFTVRGNGSEKEILKAYALFYKGIANMEINNDSTAIPILKKVLEYELSMPKLVLEARWNLCKAYYKSGKTAEAKKILDQLLSTDGFIYTLEGQKLSKMISLEIK
jgi:tetratricopeptide (TPR) repeat protein